MYRLLLNSTYLDTEGGGAGPRRIVCSCEWYVLLSCVLLSCACACDLLVF